MSSYCILSYGELFKLFLDQFIITTTGTLSSIFMLSHIFTVVFRVYKITYSYVHLYIYTQRLHIINKTRWCQRWIRKLQAIFQYNNIEFINLTRPAITVMLIWWLVGWLKEIYVFDMGLYHLICLLWCK